MITITAEGRGAMVDLLREVADAHAGREWSRLAARLELLADLALHEAKHIRELELDAASSGPSRAKVGRSSTT